MLADSPLPRLARRALLIAALAGTACADSLLPESVGGTYALVTVNGLTPPQAINENVTVIGDTLVLGADGRGTRVAWHQILPTTGPVQPVARTRTAVAIIRRGGNLWLNEVWLDIECDCLTNGPGQTALTVIGDALYLGNPPNVRLLRRVAP